MIKKSIKTLTNHPVLILFYALYLISTYLILFLLFPHDMNRFKDVNNFDFMAYGIMMIKMLSATILLGVIGILFLCGYGNMMAEAVKGQGTSAASFFPGIAKFFVRVLLAILLLMAFTFVLSMIISLISVPFILYQAIHSAGNAIYDTGYINSITLFSMVITMLFVIFLMPFVILWFPAIFHDDIGVMKGLQKGAKAGIKNYWRIVLLLAIIYLPIVIVMMIDLKSVVNGNIFTPGMMIIYLLEAILSTILIPILFYLYQGSSQMVQNDEMMK